MSPPAVKKKCDFTKIILKRR